MFAPLLNRVPPDRPAQRGRVWVLEDSPLEAEMARRALASRHEVELFTDGTLVLEQIANGARPSILVLDSQLPTLLGIDVCRLVRATHDEMALPILMLTIEGQRSSVVDALAAGANDYLTKPYDVSELLARVGVLVRTSHLHMEQTRRSRHIELAAEVGVALAHGGAIEDLAMTCARSIATHMGASFAALFEVRDGGVVLDAAAGPLARAVEQSAHVEALAARVGAGGKRGVTAPVTGPLADDLAGAETIVCAPLVLDDRSAGVLLVGLPRQVGLDEVDALVSLAQLVALGLERIRVEKERAALLERELRARTEAEAATRAKDEFLALVSHELRTPLNAILGWSELLRTKRGDDVRPVERGLDVIRRNALSQAALIDDLLDVSRIISGKLRIDRASVDLVDLVETVVESLRPSATQGAVTLRTRVTCASAPMQGDTARLKQVVSNLLTNAIKFTPKEGKIDVELGREGGWFELVVRDTGRGIEPEFLPRMFERFRQADGSMRRRHGGLGLGLSLVRHIAELHGGSVAAHSEGEGKGATFTVRLPASDVPSRPRLGDESRLPMADRIEGVRVLYVDDDEDALEFVSRGLTDAGAEVWTAPSAHDGLQRLAVEMPDVIISDVGMPGADGFFFVRRVRQLPEGGAKIPVLALTAYGHLDDRLRSEAAGFDMHLTKPVAPVELVAAIARLLRRD